MEEPEVTALIS